MAIDDPNDLLRIAERVLPQQIVLRARGCAASLVIDQTPWREDTGIQKALGWWLRGDGNWKSTRSRWSRISRATGDPYVKLAGELSRESDSAVKTLGQLYDEQAAPLLYARCLDAAWRGTSWFTSASMADAVARRAAIAASTMEQASYGLLVLAALERWPANIDRVNRSVLGESVEKGASVYLATIWASVFARSNRLVATAARALGPYEPNLERAVERMTAATRRNPARRQRRR